MSNKLAKLRNSFGIKKCSKSVLKGALNDVVKAKDGDKKFRAAIRSINKDIKDMRKTIARLKKITRVNDSTRRLIHKAQQLSLNSLSHIDTYYGKPPLSLEGYPRKFAKERALIKKLETSLKKELESVTKKFKGKQLGSKPHEWYRG